MQATSIGGDSEYVRKQTCRRPPFHSGRNRLAAAAAELAICLPLIVFLLLASLEACSMIFLDHSLTIASYEGVRMAINYDGKNSAVIARCNQILTDRGVQDTSISITPSNVANVNRGDTDHDHRLRPVQIERPAAALVLQRQNADAPPPWSRSNCSRRTRHLTPDTNFPPRDAPPHLQPPTQFHRCEREHANDERQHKQNTT